MSFYGLCLYKLPLGRIPTQERHLHQYKKPFGIRLPFWARGFKFPRPPWELTFYSAERVMHMGNGHPGWQVKKRMLGKASPLPQLNTPTNGNRISVQQRHVPKETPIPKSWLVKILAQIFVISGFKSPSGSWLNTTVCSQVWHESLIYQP